MTFYIRPKPDDLMHHGIKGQKWGVRRFQNPDGSLTPEGKERYSKKVGDISNQKEGLIATLTVIAVQKISEKIKDKQRDKAEERVKNAPKDPKTGMPLKEEDTDSKQDMKMVNPGAIKSRADTQNNCGYCTITYDLRRRGYDVIAPLIAIPTDGMKFYSKYYKDAKVTDMSEKVAYSDILKKYNDPYRLVTDRNFRKYQKALVEESKQSILKQPDGSRGYIGISWAGTYCGHSVAYEIRNRRVFIIDAQQNMEYPIEKLTSNISSLKYCQLNTLTPNYSQIKKDWGL